MIGRWQSRDNLSRNRHQELVDGINSVTPLLGDGELDIAGTTAGGNAVDPRGIRHASGHLPLKIGAALTPPGVYSVKIGKWKAQIDESTAVGLESLFEFPSAVNAVGFIVAEVFDGSGPSLGAGDVVFGDLQPGVTASKKPVFEIQRANATIPVRCDEDGTGDPGDATTQCSFVYDIYQLDNTTLIASGVEVADSGNRKAKGAYVAGTYGMAFKDNDGNWKLMYVSESATATTCTPPP